MLHLSVIQFLIKPVFVVAIFTVCACAANAQRRIPGPVDASNIETDDQQLSPMEEEMRVKRQLEASNKAHKENVNRARNLVSLSESVVSAYKANNHLSREDLKNLERAEKLVKKNPRRSRGLGSRDRS